MISLSNQDLVLNIDRTIVYVMLALLILMPLSSFFEHWDVIVVVLSVYCKIQAQVTLSQYYSLIAVESILFLIDTLS